MIAPTWSNGLRAAVLFHIMCVLCLRQRLGKLARDRHYHLHAVTRTLYLGMAVRRSCAK